jgi:outer membrane autotransporter protein
MLPRAISHCVLLAILCLLLLLDPLRVPAQGASFWPDDPYFAYDDDLRPGFPGQWHLVNGGPAQILFTVNANNPATRYTTTMVNAGVDAGLKAAWNLGYTGRGVIIGIVDDGVDSTNPDIAPNYRADLSRNFSDYEPLADAPQGPPAGRDNHGTAVAGVAAARGGNGLGGTGAAPYAQIAGLRINLDEATATDPETSYQNYLDAYYWKSGVNPTTGAIEAKVQIQVKNHSYGPDIPFVFAANSPDLKLALERTAANGVIHVFSAGNDRGKAAEDASKTYESNNSGVIVAAALGSDGKYANYSSFGSSVFVTAPSSRSDATGFGITTTDRTGADLGYNRYSASNPNGDSTDLFADTNYTSTFGGTSSSAPLVSGIMALGKEANPLLGVRLAKHLLVRTSDVVDAAEVSWKTNGAGNRFNPNYGFGNINAGKFVQEAHTAAYVTKQTSYSTGTVAVGAAIPDDDSAGVSRTFMLTGAMLDQPLEGVEVGLNFTHTKRGDLTASLASPSGMLSRLLYSTSDLEDAKQDKASVTSFSWTTLSNAFWGENGIGIWTLNLADLATGNTGTWNSFAVKLLMGRLVMQAKGKTTQATNIKAESLFISDRDVTFETPAGLTFEVEQGVTLTDGQLIVNGEITETAGVAGEKRNEVNLDGGTISGTGTINASRGVYNNVGVISPGNSIGTLTINGNYTQGAAGKFFVEVASPVSNDLLVVNGGLASLNGILQTSWTGGYTPALLTRFGTILTATTGVSGEFSRLLTNISPTILFKPKYDAPHQVYLVVERDYTNQSLSDYLTPNAKAMGGMLNGVANTATGDLNTVLDAVDGQATYARAAYALEQLLPISGTVHSNMGITGAQFQSSRIADRLGELRQGDRGLSLYGLHLVNGEISAPGRTRPVLLASNASSLIGMIPTIPEVVGERWGVFVKGDAILGEQRGTNEQAGYDFTTTGVTVGVDYRFTERFIAGVMTGLHGAKATLNDAGSKVKLEANSLGLYATYFHSGFYFDGLAHYGLNRYDNTRRIVFPGLDRTATSSPNGSQATLHGGAGYEFRMGRWTMGPTFSLQYVRAEMDGYTESGANALNLMVDKQTTESVRSNIGGRVSCAYDTAWARFAPGLWASYAHEFGNGGKTVNAALAQGSDPFGVEPASPARNFVLLGADLSATFPGGVQVYLGYTAQFGSDRYQAHGISGGVLIPF